MKIIEITKGKKQKRITHMTRQLPKSGLEGWLSVMHVSPIEDFSPSAPAAQCLEAM